MKRPGDAPRMLTRTHRHRRRKHTGPYISGCCLRDVRHSPLHSWFKVITFHLILECCPRFQILYILPDSCFSHTFIYSSSCRAASRWPWTQTPRMLQRRQESSCEAQRRSSFSNIYLAQPSPTLVKYEHRQALKPAGGVVFFFLREREYVWFIIYMKNQTGIDVVVSGSCGGGTSFSLLNLEIAVS